MTSFALQGVLKRALPFLATLGIALLITSFFIDLTPRFGRRHRAGKFQEMKRLRAENEQLKAEMERMRAEFQSREWTPMLHPGNHDFDVEINVPPPPMPPLAPVAPHSHK